MILPIKLELEFKNYYSLHCCTWRQSFSQTAHCVSFTFLYKSHRRALNSHFVKYAFYIFSLFWCIHNTSMLYCILSVLSLSLREFCHCLSIILSCFIQGRLLCQLLFSVLTRVLTAASWTAMHILVAFSSGAFDMSVCFQTWWSLKHLAICHVEQSVWSTIVVCMKCSSVATLLSLCTNVSSCFRLDHQK